MPEEIQEEKQQAEPHGETEQQETDWKAMARKWERLAKENKDAADELLKLREESSKRISELEQSEAMAKKEADDLRHIKELADEKAKLATEYDVPAYMLHGENQEELTKSAEAAAAYKREVLASVGTAPVIKDSGEAKKPPLSNAALFGEFMSNNFNK